MNQQEVLKGGLPQENEDQEYQGTHFELLAKIKKQLNQSEEERSVI